MNASILASTLATKELSPHLPDSASILSQVERIVASPAFRSSKRHPRFLKFIVEQTTLGKADCLKERVIGIEVFDRAPDYDLATDPIVRVAAGELRKRLAKYYVESEHGSELRIHLEPGSYVPMFQLPREKVAEIPASNPVLTESVSRTDVPLLHPLVARPWVSVGLVLAIVSAAAVFYVYLAAKKLPLEEFWKPFLVSTSSPLICLGDSGHNFSIGEDESPGLRTAVNSHDHLALGDVEALNRISAVFAGKGTLARISNARSTTFAELCKQAVILIGGSPNQWTMRYMQPLRYQLIKDISPGVNGIVDREHPSRLPWTVNFNVPYSAIPKEYGLIARFKNADTGQPTMIVAGVGANGVVAAAQFLTTPSYLTDFIEHAPHGWEDRNIEIILETQMINGDNGPPHVVATDIW